MTLVTKTDLDKVYNYYRIVTVHAMSYKYVIRLIIDLPLKSNDEYFELFKVRPLPHFDSDLDQFVVLKKQQKQFLVMLLIC